MADRTELEKAFDELLNLKADKPVRYKGRLGIYSNGAERVTVPNRPNFVFVRLNNSDTEICQAFNLNITPAYDLAVILEKHPTENYFRVVEVDNTVYMNLKNNSYTTQRHANTHMFGRNENQGIDPVFIYKRQMLQPLGVTPISQSMQLRIWGDYYLWNNQVSLFPDTVTNPLTSFLPTGGLSAKFVTVYLNGNDNSVGFLAGEEFPVNFYTTGVTYYIPEVDANTGIQLAAVYLVTGMTRIVWDDVYDIRNFLNNNGSMSSLVKHPLDPDGGFHTGTLQAKYVSIADAGNYYTGSNVEQALQEVYAKLLTIPTGTGASTSTSTGGHLHGLARWSAPSGTMQLPYPDLVEYIDSVFVNGIILDPLLYSLNSGSSYLLFINPLLTVSTVLSNYVVAQI